MRLLSDILYFIAYRLVRYRVSVTRANLAACFPDRTEAERRDLERRYYRHMADLLVEAVHGLFASPAAIKRRYRFANRQVVDHYYEQGRSIILVAAHYNNWEYMVASLGMQVLHHGVGVGKRLSDKVIGPFVSRRRTRFGTHVVYADNVRPTVAFFEKNRVPCAYMMLADQSPSDYHKAYWSTFLGRETAFIYGPEYFARKYNLPVVYYRVDKVRRGHYEVTFSPLCERPADVPQYAIVEAYVRRLEADIVRRPEFWLWSHRRWKHRRDEL